MSPHDKEKEIDTRVVMVVDAIFRGIGKGEKPKKHYSLTPIILDDIYQSLSLCKNEFQFPRVQHSVSVVDERTSV